jgi:hypothetical protein
MEHTVGSRPYYIRVRNVLMKLLILSTYAMHLAWPNSWHGQDYDRLVALVNLLDKRSHKPPRTSQLPSSVYQSTPSARLVNELLPLLGPGPAGVCQGVCPFPLS